MAGIFSTQRPSFPCPRKDGEPIMTAHAASTKGREGARKKGIEVDTHFTSDQVSWHPAIHMAKRYYKSYPTPAKTSVLLFWKTFRKPELHPVLDSSGAKIFQIY